MQLNADQKLAIQQGRSVFVLVDQTECVMVRRDVYEKTCDPQIPQEFYAAVEAVLDQEDDPGLASYQDYKIQ